MPDVMWYARRELPGLTDGRLVRNNTGRIADSLLADDGTNVVQQSGYFRAPGLGIGVAGAANKLMVVSGGIIDFAAANIVLTHSSNALALTGGAFGIGTTITPQADLEVRTSVVSTTLGTGTTVWVEGGSALNRLAQIGLGYNGGSANRVPPAVIAWQADTDDAYKGALVIAIANRANYTTAPTAALTVNPTGTIVVPGAINSTGSVAIAAASGYVEIMEQAAPAAGQRASCRLFTVDGGAGKRVLKAQFGTGAAVTIVTEP